jgi:hypothetical protein
MKRLIITLFLLLVTLFRGPSVFAQQSPYVPGDLMVQIVKGAKTEVLAERLSLFEGIPTGLEVKKLLSKPLGIWLFHFDSEAVNDLEFLEYVRRQPEVVLAQFNHYISERNTVPDDPQFNSQWQWVNAGGGNATADADVDADEAWDITTGGTTSNGKEIVVAVVETGINQSHPDLSANIWYNLAEIPDNGVDEDNNGYLDDYNGWNVNQDNDNIPSANHGTAVSGMIGAVGNNAAGVTGINWDVRIMSVSMQGIYESNVVEAYTYPYVQRKRFNETNGAEGAFVVAINSSWGIDEGQPADAPIWCAFYDSLGVQGILSCGATANNNVNIDQVGDLPTSCPSDYLISVTATNSSDVRTFSGFGVHTIDLAAPGGGIFTLSTNGYSSTSGTSFASPLTAGVIALMYSIPCEVLGGQAAAFPAETALKVRDALFAGVDVKSNLIPETKTGGRVNAFNSLQLLIENCGPCLKATDLAASGATDTTAVLSWNGAFDALTFDIRYKPVSGADWDTMLNMSNPFVLGGLTGCESYEYQVFTHCADTTGEYSESYIFTTEGCCVAPSGISAASAGDSTMLISWNPVYAAAEYTLVLQPLDPGSGPQTFPSPGNELLLEGLQPCAGYQVSLLTQCAQGVNSDTSETLVFFTACFCPSPANADTSLVNMNDATFSWDGAENAAEYLVRYKEATAVNWNYFNVQGNSFFIDNLDSCVNYRVQVKTICPTAESDYTTAIVFRTDCSAPSSTGEAGALPLSLVVSPNPFSGPVQLAVTLPEASSLELVLFDPLGRPAAIYDMGLATKGRHTFEIPMEQMPVGIYWLRVETEKGFLWAKALKQ